MKAFRVSLRHNDTYAFRDSPVLTDYQRVYQGLVPDMSEAAHLSVHRCGKCGELTKKWDEPLSGLVIKNRKYDTSITYDGVVIVSQMFKSIYTAKNLSGLVFRQLPDDNHFFAVHAGRAVRFDHERRKTRLINRCSQCGRYESVVGATPIFLVAGSEVDASEFVFTDLEFGTGDGKHPLLICGSTAAEALSSAKLKGLGLSCLKDYIG